MADFPVTPDLAPTDLSNLAFAKLFGENWWQLTERASSTFTGPIIPVLTIMNTVLFSFVCGYALYSIFSATLGSAATGKAGGNKFNSFWWPLRTFFGMGMTAPLTTSGLSLFQVVILSCLGWACTLANYVYVQSIDHLAQSNFMVLQADAPPIVQQNAREILDQIYDATFTQAFVAKYQHDFAEDLRERGTEPQFTPWAGFQVFSVDAYEGPAGFKRWNLFFSTPPELNKLDLGGFWIVGEKGAGTASGQNKGDDPLMMAQRNGIIKMSAVIAPVTKAIVNGEAVQAGWKERAVAAYLAEVMPVYSNFTTYYPQHAINEEAEAFKKTARELGWMAAGAMPLRMSQMSADMMEKINQRVHPVPPKGHKIQALYDDEHYKSYSVAMAGAKKEYEKEIDTLNIGTSVNDAVNAGDVDSVLDNIMDGISGRVALSALLARLEHEDPALVFGQYGHQVVNAGMVAWTTGLALSGAEGALRATGSSVWGKIAGVFTFGGSEALQGAASGTTKYIIKWLSALAEGLFIVGALFAYILPAIPTLYWILAMAAFLLLVVEVLVAAPFWAAAHAWSTQDEGLAGEMGRKGYFQLLEVLFRPSLYIMGFIAIFLIMRVVGWLTARLFEAFYTSYATTAFSHGTISAITVGSTTGLFTSIIMMIILGGLYLYLFIFLCSEGYSHLPRKVMSWIGHDSSTMGIAAGAHAMRQMIVAGVGRGARSRKNPGMLPPMKNDAPGGGKGGPKGGGNDGGDVNEMPAMEATGGEKSSPPNPPKNAGGGDEFRAGATISKKP